MTSWFHSNENHQRNVVVPIQYLYHEYQWRHVLSPCTAASWVIFLHYRWLYIQCDPI